MVRRAEMSPVQQQNTGLMRPATGPVPRQPPPSPGRRPAPYGEAGYAQGGYTDQGYAYGRYRDDPYGDSRGAPYSDVPALPEDTVFGTYGDDVYTQDGYGDDLDGDDMGKDLSRGRRRVWLVVMFVLLIVVVAVAGLGWWAQRQINPNGPPGEDVTVELESGQSTAQIAQVLHNNDVIGDPRVFTVYARVRNKGDIQAGFYELQTNMGMGDVLDVLAEGPSWDEDSALVQEGLTVEETIGRLAGPDGVEGFDEAELRAAIEGGEVSSRHFGDREGVEGLRALEGMLFPSTYKVGQNETEAELLQRMVAEFDDLYEELGVEAQAADLGLASGYEVLIVASMIEREARLDEDRPKIARVIYNRLEQGHPLQIDATSCYDKEGECHPLSAEDLEGPYSTRNEAGLPPTPIAAPGEASLEAALNPEPGDWFYYVLDVEANDGSHVITADESEWEAARQLCVQEGLCG